MYGTLVREQQKRRHEHHAHRDTYHGGATATESRQIAKTHRGIVATEPQENVELQRRIPATESMMTTECHSDVS